MITAAVICLANGVMVMVLHAHVLHVHTRALTCREQAGLPAALHSVSDTHTSSPEMFHSE